MYPVISSNSSKVLLLLSLGCFLRDVCWKIFRMENLMYFLMGHSRKGGTDPLYVAENAADPDLTLVVYMGLLTVPSLAAKLMHHGLPQDTPAAAIERGTTPQQRIMFAELQYLADEILSHQLLSPTLIIIGKVVALSPSWPHIVK